MDIYYSLFIAFLAILYILILLFAVKRNSYSFRTINAGNDKNIEARLRILMRENPRSEIVVINDSALSETEEILQKMQYDFPEIHIVSHKKSR